LATDGLGLTDRRTVEAAKAGDEDAWRVLFEAHFAKVARFFRWRVSSETVAEDLAAEVFADAYRGLGKFRWRNRPFEAWLFAIARNRLAMHYRKLRDEAELQPETEYRRNEYLAVEIRDVLDQLPEDYRTAIELRYLIGLSGQEAAAAMDRSHGSFRVLLHRASKAFRDEYQGEG
jgi:RNA polymerase sigma-70 factor (ECF subfamily)